MRRPRRAKLRALPRTFTVLTRSTLTLKISSIGVADLRLRGVRVHDESILVRERVSHRFLGDPRSNDHVTSVHRGSLELRSLRRRAGRPVNRCSQRHRKRSSVVKTILLETKNVFHVERSIVGDRDALQVAADTRDLAGVRLVLFADDRASSVRYVRLSRCRRCTFANIAVLPMPKSPASKSVTASLRKRSASAARNATRRSFLLSAST